MAAILTADPKAPGGWLREAPFWALAALLHLLFFLLLLSVVTAVPEKGPPGGNAIFKADPPSKKPRPDRYDPNLPRKMAKIPPTVPPTKPEEIKPQPPEIDLKPPSGIRIEDLPVTPLIPIGFGPVQDGPWGPRTDHPLARDVGWTEESECAVRTALEWLCRHQSADGSWKGRDFTGMCEKACANANSKYGDGRGWSGHDAGITGLAMLAFAGFGHTHQDGLIPEYVACLKKAVRYLKSVQVRSADPNANGRYGGAESEQWIYGHAIATLAMAELLAMSNDVIGLKKSVTDAVQLCLQAQNPGYGWKYGIKPGRNDTSVTGWMVLALKTAKNARLDLPRERFDEALKGALVWLDRATSVATGRTGYESPGDEGSALKGEYPDPYPFSKELSCMTAVGVLCRLFSGQSRADPVVKRGVDLLLREPPRWVEPGGRGLSKINFYYWYYGSYALFQFGGKPWKNWNEDMQSALISTQRRGGDEDGSWDPIDEWGKAGGRIYATAMGAMTLEVYYRYRRITRRGA